MTTTSSPIWELPDTDEPVEGLDEHGDPIPEYAAALGLLPAPLGRRAAAVAVDVGLLALLQVPFLVLAFPLVRRWVTGRVEWYGFTNHPDFLVTAITTGATAFITLAVLVAQVAFLGRKGFTVGKLATGVRVVNVRTLGKPGFGRTLGRALVVWALLPTVVVPLALLASPALDRHGRRRGWHDRLGQAWVVDVRRGLDPYDHKRMRIARKTVRSAPAPRPRELPSLATQDADRSGYRPGARSSASVLGFARPHRAAERVSIGLSGLQPSPPPPPVPGVPRLGAFADVPAENAPSTTPAQLPERPRTIQSLPTAPTPTPAPAPAAAPAPPAAPRVLSDHGPVTRVASDHGAIPPAPPSQSTHGVPSNHGVPGPDSSATALGPAYTLDFDTGEQVELTGGVVVGRLPEERPGARPLPIDDPALSISKTHVLLRPAPAGVEVVDQGSTNGTSIQGAHGAQRLEPGVVGLARPGDVVRFGDRFVRVRA